MTSEFLAHLRHHVGDAALADVDAFECVLLEHQLRVLVLSAQSHAGMWKRNGYSLLNQLHNYSSAQCRQEMFDRDVQQVQVREHSELQKSLTQLHA